MPPRAAAPAATTPWSREDVVASIKYKLLVQFNSPKDIICTVDFFVAKRSWTQSGYQGQDHAMAKQGALPAPNQLARSRRQLLLRHRRSAYADFDAYASVRNMHNGRKDLGEEDSDEDSDEE